MYDSIIIDVSYFQQGDFWIVIATGFATNPHDINHTTEDEIDSDWDKDEKSALDTANYWKDYYLKDKSNNIVIHLNGSEIGI